MNPDDVESIEINSRDYTLQSGSAAKIRRAIANDTFSGFRGREERRALRNIAELAEQSRSAVDDATLESLAQTSPPPDSWVEFDRP